MQNRELNKGNDSLYVWDVFLFIQELFSFPRP